MSHDPLVLTAELDRATGRLLAGLADLDGAALAGPSLLPGWSRGHVLSHLARNADALGNLLTWARTGVVTPAYASAQAREAGIAAGAGRDLAGQVADLRDSAGRFAALAAAMPAPAWLVELDLPGGPAPAAHVMWRRLREVEVHHVDLDLAYRPAHWPDSFSHRLLHEVATGLAGVDLTLVADGVGHRLRVGAGGPPEVSGDPATLAAWLCGRGTGAGLSVSPAGPLPAVPAWI